MAVNSNNLNNSMKNIGGLNVPTGFSNSGQTPAQSMPPPPMNHAQHPQPPAHDGGGTHFPGHFQLSEPQAQALAQAQYVQAQAQAQARAAHARFQAQLQAQAQAQSLSHKQNPIGGINSSNSNINIGVSSPSLSTPMNAKRSAQKPSSRPPSSSGATAGSPLKTMELAPAARRRKRSLPDKQIPEKVATILPESALYTQLLEFEGRVDAALARKKVDIQESIKNPPRMQKTLRIYVFNTFSNQNHKENADPPSWSLKIIGRLLENRTDSSPPSSNPKFSSYFKKITIYLDQNLYPDNHVILWESSRSSALNEGFEVKRKGDKEFTAIIRIEMNYTPEKFKLSPALTEVLGLEVETRPRIIAAIWQYIKAKKLQNPTDNSCFTCDPSLRKVFGEEKVKFAMISHKISQHLSPPQAIHLEHKVKLSGGSPAGNTCYDVLVDVPFSLDKDMSNFLENLEKHREIDACDEAICSAIKKIHEHRRRRAFFLGFSQSPSEFINTLVASQSKDLKTAAGDAARAVEKEHRSDFYNQPWVEDAVIRYLNRKPTAGTDAPGST